MVEAGQKYPRRSSCGRGVLKFKTWKPLPRPGELSERCDAQSTQRQVRTAPPTKVIGADRASTENVKPKKGMRMILIKYSYKANPDRPGGFDELSVKQGDKIYFHSAHPNNPHWVKAENLEGEIGYVPATYIMEIESKPSQLPWLENKRIEREAEKDKEKDRKGTFPELNGRMLPPKQYVSAYNTQESVAASDYSCDLCGKVFNGPHPFRLHMSSKAHKEEVEAQKYR